MSNDFSRSVPLALLVTLAACGGGSAAHHRPGGLAEAQPRCLDSSDGGEQLTAAWPAEERAELELQAKQGMVLVRYEDCTFKVLRDCRAKGEYSFAPAALRDDEIVISSERELERLMPSQAPQLRGELERSGKLLVRTATVGRYVATAPTVSRQDLVGDCQGATHYLASMATGAFAFGPAHSEAGPDASSSPLSRTLASAGDRGACSAVSGDGARPPERCAEIVRIELAPLGSVRGPSMIASRVDGPGGETATPAASFPDGSLIKGSGPEIYLVEGGQRRHVPDPSTFNAMGLDWNKVKTIGDKELTLVPLGEPLPNR